MSDDKSQLKEVPPCALGITLQETAPRIIAGILGLAVVLTLLTKLFHH